ncbi:hypothetical protein ID866_10809 [Astraeus odoratus]|nr:hypothetical protein ID866_10809 [Astraeus odoratus]
MDKGNAFDYVQNRNIDPRPLLKDISDALYYLHGHDKGPIVHGDLKGQNVLISKYGRGLLTDFGLSTLVNSSFSMSTSVHHVGTAAWLAPELICGSASTTESDIWAYGMTALELLTAKRPYHGVERMPIIIFKILSGPPPRPSDESTCARMTDEWWDLCSLCWRRDPSSRPAISEVIKKLRCVY